MNADTKLMVIASLSEMRRNLQRSHVLESTIRAAVMNTAGNLFGNDCDEIVDAALQLPQAGCYAHRGAPVATCNDCVGEVE